MTPMAESQYRQLKQAAGIVRSPAQMAQAKRDALWQLLQIGLIGGGAGVAGRSALGLSRWLNTPADPLLSGAANQIRPEIRLPEFKEEKEKLAASATSQKQPFDLFQMFSNMLPDISTSQPLGDWWGPAAAVTTAGTGILGGYGVSDWLLDTERKNFRQRQVDKAEQDYQDALAEEYRSAMMNKRGSDDLGVDALYDALSAHEKKAADFIDTAQLPWEIPLGHNNWQQAKGWLLASMLATGLGSGAAMYGHTKKQQRQKLLERALKQRQRRMSMMSPAPPLIIPPAPRMEEEEGNAI